MLPVVDRRRVDTRRGEHGRVGTVGGSVRAVDQRVIVHWRRNGRGHRSMLLIDRRKIFFINGGRRSRAGGDGFRCERRGRVRRVRDALAGVRRAGCAQLSI